MASWAEPRCVSKAGNNRTQEDKMVDAEARYYEQLEREYQEMSKIPQVKGCPAVSLSGTCDGCGKEAVLYGRDACTLGYPGHPGAEWTRFQVCETCLTTR